MCNGQRRWAWRFRLNNGHPSVAHCTDVEIEIDVDIAAVEIMMTPMQILVVPVFLWRRQFYEWQRMQLMTFLCFYVIDGRCLLVLILILFKFNLPREKRQKAKDILCVVQIQIQIRFQMNE